MSDNKCAACVERYLKEAKDSIRSIRGTMLELHGSLEQAMEYAADIDESLESKSPPVNESMEEV